jgi:hypothetical protein
LGFLDGIKIGTAKLTKKAAEQIKGGSKDDAPTEPEEVAVEGEGLPAAIADEGPSRAVRGVMSTTASWLLKASKKTMDVLVSRYEPVLSVDSILEPEDIEFVMKASADKKKVRAVAVMWLATNSLETLGAAKTKRDQLIEKKTLQADDERLTLVFGALEAIADGDTSAAETAVGKLIETDPEFNHPVVARFMIEQLRGRPASVAELAAWCEKAVYYFPLDPTILAAASEVISDGQPVFGQLQKIAR